MKGNNGKQVSFSLDKPKGQMQAYLQDYITRCIEPLNQSPLGWIYITTGKWFLAGPKLRIRIPVFWFGPDSDPGILVGAGSGSRYFGRSWIRILVFW